MKNELRKPVQIKLNQKVVPEKNGLLFKLIELFGKS